MWQISSDQTRPAQPRCAKPSRAEPRRCLIAAWRLAFIRTTCLIDGMKSAAPRAIRLVRQMELLQLPTLCQLIESTQRQTRKYYLNNFLILFFCPISLSFGTPCELGASICVYSNLAFMCQKCHKVGSHVNWLISSREAAGTTKNQKGNQDSASIFFDCTVGKK